MPAPTPRRILLVDADAFFVAVARMADPDGAGKAPLLIVGGSADGRGVVASASYEARRFGVRSAMPTARALRLCPDAMVVPVPRGWCGRKSREIRRVLERFAPVVTGASIDEWYCSLDGTEALYNEPLETTARRMRAAVQTETGLSVSIGGGTNRLIAKLAVERAKPSRGSDGVHVVAPGDEAAFMAGVELREIAGVGPKFQARLTALGLRTVPDVLARDAAALARQLGESDAGWLLARARGIDESPVEGDSAAKQISREETFARDIADDAELREELRRLTSAAAAELRSDGLRARTVTVRLRDADFTTRSASRSVAEALESDRGLFSLAVLLLRKLRTRRRVPARLIGVALSGLREGDRGGQLTLFEPAPGEALETERDRTVSRVVDDLRARFGADAVGIRDEPTPPPSRRRPRRGGIG